MRMVKTHGLSAESMQACQERLEDLPARSPIRKEVSHYVQQYLPIVESNDSPMLGSSDVIASLIGKAKQRLEANGRSELHTSILLIPCMCGDLTQDLVAEALTTVRVQDVATWVSETVGETMQSIRRRELSRPQPQQLRTSDSFLKMDIRSAHAESRSRRHVFETNANGFALILQLHRTKPVDHLAQEASIRQR